MMFYSTESNAHGLRYDPLKALVVPRPIGWISTASRDGRHNLAPYSFFNMVHDNPPIVLFSSGGPKDSATHAEQAGAFVANFVSEQLAVAMNATSVDAPRGESEFAYAGLTAVASELVAAPRVAEAYAALECRVTEMFRPKTLAGESSDAIVVMGQVVGVHIDERILTEGKVDVAKAKPVARLGYLDFTVVKDAFALRRPKWGPHE